jgi:outer membrane protein insertion porin family
LILSSCQATSFLNENETFLHKNTIKFVTPQRIENKALLKEELYTFYEQIPNENILWVNRQWFHYIIQSKKNNWFNKFIKKSLAQEPSLFNEEKSKSTASNLQTFLRDKRGFYDANVNYNSYRISKYLTDVEYIINTGKQYKLNSIKYESKDMSVDSIINNSLKSSFLISGDPISSTNYDLEKIRITNILQNEGYAAFNQDYFDLRGDSSNYKVDLQVIVKKARDNIDHIKYDIGKVNVFTDYYPTQVTDSLDSVQINGIGLFRELDNFIINPYDVVNAIAIRPGEVFSKEKNAEIYTRLSKYSIYKFISIKTEIDTTAQGILNYNIYMYLNEYKYSYEGGTSIKYLRLSSDENFINTGINGLIYDRNVSSRGDNLSFNGSGDLKINISDGSFQEVNLDAKLDYSYPNTSASIKLTPIFFHSSLIAGHKYSKLKNNATSNLSLSYNHQNILNNFQISSFNLNYGYNYFSKIDGLRMHFSQAGINYFTTSIINDELFNDFQKKSLNDFFQTGLIFKNFIFDFKNNSESDRFFTNSLFGLEISGSEIYLINKLFNSITNSIDDWRYNKTVNYAKFIKANIDIRPKYKTNRTNEIAGRIYAGIGVPFGDSQSLPYIKQFEAGGPVSMRAWTARSLGPGSYIDTSGLQTDYPFQKGDIKLEANIEYRFKLSSYFRSAVFLDAGNIWTIKFDPERPGSQFRSDFYKQIALNAGVSLQLDVFLLLRFDLAFKLRNPYKNEFGKYWDNNSFKPTFVFSINNPF